MSTLDVTIVQADLHWHDPERNRGDFAKLLARREEPTDLVVLPEMFTTGFTMHAREHAERMDGPSIAWMTETAARTGAALCGSLIIEDGGRYYNRFILVHPDGKADYYDKRHLFRLAGEHEHYAAGSTCETFTLGGWRIRPLVCYDLRFPVWSRNRNDYDLLVYVANWPEPRHIAWETLLRARAVENIAYVAGVNRVGIDGNDVPYVGGSAIVDYTGKYLVTLGKEPGLASAKLDMGALGKFRDRFPFWRDADEFSLEDRSGARLEPRDR